LNRSEQYPIFEISGYRVRLLGPDDLPALQSLLERCADYNRMVSGDPPGSDAAEHLLDNRPPGRSSEDKAVIGIYDVDRNLVSVLDAVCDYPQTDCWWVGLLLIDSAHRNQGLGRRIYQCFEQWVAQQGTKYVLLGVIEENEKAYRFWQSMGFEEIEKQQPRRFGNIDHVIVTMACDISNKERPVRLS
jgi:GNAT superfamily N-acetyltransferase